MAPAAGATHQAVVGVRLGLRWSAAGGEGAARLQGTNRPDTAHRPRAGGRVRVHGSCARLRGWAGSRTQAKAFADSCTVGPADPDPHALANGCAYSDAHAGANGTTGARTNGHTRTNRDPDADHGADRRTIC